MLQAIFKYTIGMRLQMWYICDMLKNSHFIDYVLFAYLLIKWKLYISTKKAPFYSTNLPF